MVGISILIKGHLDFPLVVQVTHLDVFGVSFTLVCRQKEVLSPQHSRTIQTTRVSRVVEGWFGLSVRFTETSWLVPSPNQGRPRIIKCLETTRRIGSQTVKKSEGPKRRLRFEILLEKRAWRGVGTIGYCSKGVGRYRGISTRTLDDWGGKVLSPCSYFGSSRQ